MAQTLVNGVTSVGTSATLIASVSGGASGVLLQNLGSQVLFVGGPNVTADTSATGGIQLPATMTSPVLVPLLSGGPPTAIFGRVASTSANVAFAYPT